MKLSLLLFLLSLKLKIAAKSNKTFQNYIGTIQLKILIKTANNRWGRLFVFDKGKVLSHRGTNYPFDAALVWKDSATAFRVMIKGTDEASFYAAAEGKLKVEGMSYYIQWFNDAVKIIM
jgi:hypothetical protein